MEMRNLDTSPENTFARLASENKPTQLAIRGKLREGVNISKTMGKLWPTDVGGALARLGGRKRRSGAGVRMDCQRHRMFPDIRGRSAQHSAC